jgi:hypothetical protein
MLGGNWTLGVIWGNSGQRVWRNQQMMAMKREYGDFGEKAEVVGIWVDLRRMRLYFILIIILFSPFFLSLVLRQLPLE